MKKCPFCAEEIQDDAIKCRFCGEWLDKLTSGQQAENIYEVPPQKPATESFIENHSSSYQEVSFKKSHSDIDKTLSERLSMLDKVENSFRKLKLSIIAIYLFPSIFSILAAIISLSESIFGSSD